MKKNERFFSKFMTAAAVFASLLFVCDLANAATRVTTRNAPAARKNVTTIKTTSTTQDTEQKTESEAVVETVDEQITEEFEQPELIISNKSSQFENVVYDIMESAAPDNSFAEEIRRQRAALAASEAKSTTNGNQQRALATNSHTCDVGLRKCMSEICGKDFTKCATDGDTAFGDKLNRCRRNIECSAEEFSLFVTEIKADRDANVKLSSYNNVIECGNSYNACIMNECGTTYNKCLGKTAESAAIQKCSTIANECREADSGLSSRFGVAMGKLRENAEKDIKKDESRLYTLRDLMEKQCKSLGAAFDERSFDCVYTVNFYAGANQSSPIASRKAYAGDSFVCTQEWFGVNTTTYQENAYRETRAQTAASSAMLGSGLGTAVGTLSSGAIDRAIDTTKAKNAYKEECEKKGEGYYLKNDKCVYDASKKKLTDEAPTTSQAKPQNIINKTVQKEQDLTKTIIDATKNPVKAVVADVVEKGSGTETREETELSREELSAIVSATSNGEDAHKALNQYQKNKENETDQDLEAKVIAIASNPTKAIVDNVVKSVPATSALSSDGQTVVNNEKETSSSTTEQQPTAKKEVKPRTVSTNSNNDKAVAKTQKKTEKEQEKQSKAARKDRQETRDANRQEREEARAKKKEEKSAKPENNNTKTNTNSNSTNDDTTPAPKPTEPAAQSTTTVTNAANAAATTAATAVAAAVTTPTPKSEPVTNTAEITPAEKITKKQTDTDRPYQIPINERPTITSNETDCDRLSEQAVYCFAISNQTSDCKNSFTVQHLIEVSVKQEYRNARISPDSQNATQTYWESKDQVLPSIKQYCRTHIMGLDKHNANASKTYQESAIIDPTLPKPKQKSSNTTSTSGEKTKQKYASKAECEANIDAAFANGVPSEYKSIYNQQLKRLENIQTNTSTGEVRTYLHTHMVKQDPIICRGITYHLKECENASSILPQIAVYAAREKSKERDCGTYLKKDIVLDFSVGSDHYSDMIYK